MAFTLTARVWQLELPGTQKMVLLRLADAANKNTRLAWLSVPRIAQECGVSERQVQRTLAALRGQRLIDIARPATQRRPTTYAIHPERGRVLLSRVRGDTMSPLEDDPGVTFATGRGDIGDSPGVTSATPRGDTHVTQNRHRNQELEPVDGTIPPSPPLRRGDAPAAAERGRNGSRRQRDVEAADAEDGPDAKYFRGKYGRLLKARLDAPTEPRRARR